MRKNSPQVVLVSNLVGKANESTIIFCGEKTPALIDSGSMVTTVSEDYLNTLHPKPEIIGLEELVLSGPDGKELPYLGYTEATIQAEFLFDKEISVPALVVSSTSYHSEVPIVVGTNVIRICKDKCRDTDHIPTEWQDAFLSLQNGNVGSVRSTNKMSFDIQQMETITVSGLVRKQKEIESAVTEQTENVSSKIGVCPRVVSLNKPEKTVRVPVRIFNMSAKTLTIQPKSLLCQLQEVKVLRGSNPLLGENYTARSNQQTVTTNRKEDESQNKTFRLSDIGVDIKDSKISEEQKEKATEIFRKWQDIFSRGPTDLGHTDLDHHEIKLTDGKLFKEPYRRISPNMIEEVREHIAEMLQADAIRPSQSPFSSNVVLVRKKDGTLRLCIDFRKLNQRTIKDAYAIPRIEDSLHLLVGSKFITKLDLKAGYWQVELKEEDKMKTEFQVGNIGFYECNRMPFGLCNAPATFQRLMERAMGDINLRDCLIYLDDIIFFSLIHLKNTLIVLRPSFREYTGII